MSCLVRKKEKHNALLKYGDPIRLWPVLRLDLNVDFLKILRFSACSDFLDMLDMALALCRTTRMQFPDRCGRDGVRSTPYREVRMNFGA